ncbi:MAG TPA: YdgA family protein [Gammaproteobacteria bacterium]
MNKPLIALGSVLAVALLGLPPVLGMITESQVAQRVESLRDHPVFTAELESFERGWFGSRARIGFGLSPAYVAQVAASTPEASAEELSRRATIVVDIAHGPVAVGDGVHFGLSSFVARPDPGTAGIGAVLERLRIPYLFEFRGRTGLSGVLDFDADIPGFELADPNGQLAFAGATLEGSLDGTLLEYRARSDHLRVAPAGEPSVSLEGLRMSADLDVRSAYLLLGAMDGEVDRVQVWDPAAAPVFDASGLRVAGEWRPNGTGDRVDAAFTYTLASAMGSGGIDLADAAFGVTVRDVDVAAAQAYYETVQRAMANGTSDPDALLADLEPVIWRFLAASPSVALEPMRFRWQGEPFDASLHVEVDGATLPPGGAFDLRSPVFWVSAVDATARANVSKKLAEDITTRVLTLQLAEALGGDDALPSDQLEYMAGAQAGLMLVTLVTQGLLLDDGDEYSTRIEFRDGALTINGAPLPTGFP